MSGFSVREFTIDGITQYFPDDGATKFLSVTNVTSPMSSHDVKQLFPSGLEWRYMSNITRTNFIVRFETESDARKSFRDARGVSFLGKRLFFAYVQGVDACQSSFECDGATDESCGGGAERNGAPVWQRTQAQPEIAFLLARPADHARRLAEASRIIDVLPIIPSPLNKWVDTR